MFRFAGLTKNAEKKVSSITGIKSNPLILPPGFTVTAHAGALGLPANTIAALEKAIETGVDVVEMDVTFRSNKVPVIIHSEKPGKKQGVLFEDALELVAKYDCVKINLDLKSFTNLSVIQELAEKNNLLNRVFFTGVTEDEAAQVKAECPKIDLYLNETIPLKVKDDIQFAKALASKILSLGGIGLNCSYGQISKTIVDEMHKTGLFVSVWTVDEEPEMVRMLSFAVDNITTRFPDMIFNIIKNWQ